MGFVSLLLAFLQDKIGKVCMPDFLLHFWLPCGFVPRKNKREFPAHFQVTSSGVLSNRGRHLYLLEALPHAQRYLKFVYTNSFCQCFVLVSPVDYAM